MITLEEAIKHFEDWTQCNYQPTKEAAEMALSALRAQQEVEKNEPLTLEEIYNLDKFPVFFVPKEQDSDALPGWCIYRGKTATARSATRKSCLYFFYRKDYGKKWLAYRRPPKEVP